MRYVLMLVLAFVVACGGSKSPTGPSDNPSTQTRIIAIDGSLNFGGVPIGQSSTQTITIRNTGNSPLTVTGMTVPGGAGPAISVSWADGQIPANSAQPVNVRFAPTTTTAFNGNFTVNGNHTSGTNFIGFSGRGTLDGVPVFFHSGIGDNVFTVPPHVTRLKVDASYPGSCQNFIVRISTQITSLINIIIGTCSVADTRSPFSGTYAINGGGQVTITGSTGVHWAFTELR